MNYREFIIFLYSDFELDIAPNYDWRYSPKILEMLKGMKKMIWEKSRNFLIRQKKWVAVRKEKNKTNIPNEKAKFN